MNKAELINDQLKSVYRPYLEEMIGLYDDFEKSKLSLPILIHAFEDYFDAKIKILIVGQETKDWFGKLCETEKFNVEYLTDAYKKFELAKCYKGRNSPFWRFSKNIYQKFNPNQESKKGFLHTNLSKSDFDGKAINNKELLLKGRIGRELLLKEIEILKPDLLVFITGHHRDYLLRELGAKLDSDCIIEPKYLCRPSYSGLFPKNTFRTYHPRWLNSKKSEHNIPSMIDLIENHYSFGQTPFI